MNKLPLPPQLAVIFQLQVAASALIKFTSAICSWDFILEPFQEDCLTLMR